jgi:hypothetical protein
VAVTQVKLSNLKRLLLAQRLTPRDTAAAGAVAAVARHAATTAVTTMAVSDVTVTHLSCDTVTPVVMLGLVGGRTVRMRDVGIGNVL